MPTCEVRIIREPDGQYSWLYYKDNKYQEFGGANLTLAAAFNAGRDKIAAEANVGQSKEITLIADVP